MASVLFHPIVAVQPETGELVRGADGQIFAETDVNFANPLPIFDSLGTPIGAVSVGPNGLTQTFRVADLDRVVWRSGSYVLPIWSPQGLIEDAKTTLAAAVASADAARAALAALEAFEAGGGGGGGGGGVSVHGALSGLDADDHPQYHDDKRGDVRYYTKTQADSKIGDVVNTASTENRKRSNHSGTQTASTISDLTAAVVAALGGDVAAFKFYSTLPTAAQLAAAGVPNRTVVFTPKVG